MEKYYKYDDKIVNSFLFVPKFLFSDKRYKKLSISDKLIYSLYLHRYTISKYNDDIGRYIIFSDEDLTERLNITQRTCVRAKKKLEELGLIKIQRTVGYNKIYLVNTNKSSDEITHFFTEDDLEGLKFYKYPREFFNEKYNNLSLNAKMVYTVFLDTLSLSQVNYFVDENERIYFQEEKEIQMKKLNLTGPTIKEARNLLMVCGLLLEYRTFIDIRYYPLKLSHYIDRVDEYKKCKSAKEKNDYIEKITKADKEELILNPLKIGVKLKKYREEAGLTQLQVVERLKKKGVSISKSSYSSYETGTVHITKERFDLCVECILGQTKDMSLKNGPKEKNVTKDDVDIKANEKNCHVQSVQSKNKSVVEENDVTDQDKDMSFAKARKSHTNNTELKENEKNYNEKLIELINSINNSINTSHILLEERDYLIACFDKLRIYKRFYLNTSQELFTTERLYEVLEKMNDRNKVEEICMKILDRIETSHYRFNSPDAAINCFITFLLNDLKVEQKNEDVPAWFAKKKFQYSRLPERQIDVPDEVKDFKWWEE